MPDGPSGVDSLSPIPRPTSTEASVPEQTNPLKEVFGEVGGIKDSLLQPASVGSFGSLRHKWNLGRGVAQGADAPEPITNTTPTIEEDGLHLVTPESTNQAVEEPIRLESKMPHDVVDTGLRNDFPSESIPPDMTDIDDKAGKPTLDSYRSGLRGSRFPFRSIYTPYPFFWDNTSGLLPNSDIALSAARQPDVAQRDPGTATDIEDPHLDRWGNAEQLTAHREATLGVQGIADQIKPRDSDWSKDRAASLREADADAELAMKRLVGKWGGRDSSIADGLTNLDSVLTTPWARKEYMDILESAVREAQLDEAFARDDVRRARQEVRRQEASLNEARRALKEAERQYELRQQTSERGKGLRSTVIGAATEIDMASAGFSRNEMQNSPLKSGLHEKIPLETPTKGIYNPD